MSESTKFPKNFLWGTSTSSHQIEGNTTNDWTMWEHANAERLSVDVPKTFSKTSPVWEQIKAEATNPANYISGAACDSYNLFEKDIALISELGIKAYRFSVEWSRIEPEPGVFNQDAINHYSTLIDLLLSKNITPFLTTLHRTIPIWVAEQGGWGNRKTVDDYCAYVQVLADHFASRVQFWLPLNEPVLNVGGGFVTGQIPQGRKNIFVALSAYRNMIAAHNHAYKIIHRARSDAQVGPAHAAVYAEAEHNAWYNRFLVSLVHYFADWMFLDGIKHHTDFIGIQYYTRGVLGLRLKNLLPSIQNVPQLGPTSDMGQEIYPVGIYKFIDLIWKRYHRPIYVTENGIADRNDTYRAKFIADHVAKVEYALADGIDVRGYFYWSLLDNFEWDKGFWPRFGLAEVNHKTFERTLRKSAYAYSAIIKNNGVSHEV